MVRQIIPGYFDIILKLHKAKIDCFLPLAKGCTTEELVGFVAYDLCKEIEGAISWACDRGISSSTDKVDRKKY